MYPASPTKRSGSDVRRRASLNTRTMATHSKHSHRNVLARSPILVWNELDNAAGFCSKRCNTELEVFRDHLAFQCDRAKAASWPSQYPSWQSHKHLLVMQIELRSIAGQFQHQSHHQSFAHRCFDHECFPSSDAGQTSQPSWLAEQPARCFIPH